MTSLRSMLFGTQPYTLDNLARLAIRLALLWGGVLLLSALSEVLIPFAIALLLAYLTDPLVRRVQRVLHSRAASVIVTLAGLLLLLVGLLWLLVPMIAGEVASTARLFSDFFTDSAVSRRAQERLPDDVWLWIQEQGGRDKIQTFLKSDTFLEFLRESFERILPLGRRLLGGLTSVLLASVGVIVIAMYLVFLLIDYERVRQDWWSLFPAAQRESLREFLTSVDREMNRYFRAQAMIASLVGVMFALAFSIIGLPMGILLGLFVGLLNMVPYLQIVSLVPVLLMGGAAAIQSGESFVWMLVQILLVYGIIQSIQDWLLVPKIMGDASGLSPAIILLSLSIWGKLLGFLGLLLAIPMTCICLAYYKRFLEDPPEESSGTESVAPPQTPAEGGVPCP